MISGEYFSLESPCSEEYAKSEGLGDPLVLQNSIIKEMSTSIHLVPEELREIVSKIANGESLST